MAQHVAPSRWVGRGGSVSQTLLPKATFLIGPRGPEYRRDDQTQAIRWYLYDGLGSVLGEVDTAGNLTAARKYDVYGLVRAGDSGTSRHKFVGSLGHTSEDETGLIYMRARWMDPVLGRFISEDPARDGANWFAYCRGNPVNAVDPDGKRPLNGSEWDHYWTGMLLSYQAFGWAVCAAMCPGPAGAAFLAAGVASFFAAMYHHSMALGANDGRGLMFGGGIGIMSGLGTEWAGAMLVSAGRLGRIGAVGVATGGAVVSWVGAVVAALWLCERIP